MKVILSKSGDKYFVLHGFLKVDTTNMYVSLSIDNVSTSFFDNNIKMFFLSFQHTKGSNF